MGEYEILKARVRELEKSQEANTRSLEQFTTIVSFIGGLVLAYFGFFEWLWPWLGLFALCYAVWFVIRAIREEKADARRKAAARRKDELARADLQRRENEVRARLAREAAQRTAEKILRL
jgi:hypothetical protein